MWGAAGLMIQSGKPTRADEAALPVVARVVLHANDTTRTRSVDELIAADCNSHVRGAATLRLEKHQIPGFDVVTVNAGAELVLIVDLTRQSQAMLREHPLHEPAAIEAARIAAAIAVRNAAVGQRRFENCCVE